MAFKTQAQLRALVNTDLGRTDGSSAPWGTDAAVNAAIAKVIGLLWPRMARGVQETVTPTEGTMDYTLTGIRDVVSVLILDADGLEIDRVRSWSVIVDESADPIVRRLQIPVLDSTSDLTLRVHGYQPYTNVFATDAASCDIPNEYEWIVVEGVRAEAFKRRMLEFADYEQRASSNPVTNVTLEELRENYLIAKAQFEQAIRDHSRDASAPRRAQKTIR